MHNQKRLTFHHSIIALCLLLPSVANSATEELDRIVVVINDDVITNNELAKRTSDFATQLKISPTASAEYKALKKQVLEKMIENRIQSQLANQLGITIDDITLNRMLEKLAKSNNVTLDELIATLNREGLDYNRFREQTRNELIIKQLQQRVVANKVNISDQEISQFINENLEQSSLNNKYHLHHILIATPENAKAEDIQKALSKAESIYEKIQNGDNFNDLAVRESAGRLALQGGDLGRRSGNELPEIFINAIKDLKSGETAKPVQSAGGFHILKLIDNSSNQSLVQLTHSRHILIRSDSSNSDDKIREQLAQIRQRIINGESFAELATEFSQDPGFKEKGGDLGWTNSSSFVEEFKQVMDSLDNDQISEPFRTQFGWHIVQVLDRREQDVTRTNLEAQARQSIQKRKIDEAVNLWLRKIRDEAYVEYIDKSFIKNE